MNTLTAKQKAELDALAALPEESIDTSDIPELKRDAKGVRGQFYRPDTVAQLPIYLEAEVMNFLSKRAELKNIDASTLANALLRKDVELILAAEA